MGTTGDGGCIILRNNKYPEASVLLRNFETWDRAAVISRFPPLSLSSLIFASFSSEFGFIYKLALFTLQHSSAYRDDVKQHFIGLSGIIFHSIPILLELLLWYGALLWLLREASG